MPKKVIIYAGITIAVLSLAFYFVNWTISTGLIVGYLFSLIYIGVLTLSVKLITSENPGGLLIVIGSLIRMVILALPLLYAGLMPQYLSIYGVFAGLLMFKLWMYLTMLFNKGGL